MISSPHISRLRVPCAWSNRFPFSFSTSLRARPISIPIPNDVLSPPFSHPASHLPSIELSPISHVSHFHFPCHMYFRRTNLPSSVFHLAIRISAPSPRCTIHTYPHSNSHAHTLHNTFGTQNRFYLVSNSLYIFSSHIVKLTRTQCAHDTTRCPIAERTHMYLR